ncbi:unnamed protein product [Parnassius apollo]|uniref:(apollo) hypothetical protein n=1 Tax=Parnassius apollo TaxID=110799 RepID=A0A8S3XE96_PARAO|nr:unnamed protein product [Parnassius apollo]
MNLMCVLSEEIFSEAPSVEKVEGDARALKRGDARAAAGALRPLPRRPCPLCPPAPLPPSTPHPLRALDDMPPVLRSNPIYTEEEEQEVVIIVDSLEAPEVPDAPRVPRRAPSTSSGYGSGGGSHGRVSPTLPKIETYEPEPTRRLSDCEKNEGSHTTSDSDGSPSCTLSRSLKDDIRSCLGGCSEYRCSPGVSKWEREVEAVVAAAARGAGGAGEARARLQAALRALHEPALRYCGPGVRPGDVTMLPKNNLSLLSKR